MFRSCLTNNDMKTIRLLKKNFLGLMMAMVVASCTAAESKLHVKMNIKGMGDSVAVVSIADRENPQTFAGKQGVFDFEVDVPQVTMYLLVDPCVLRGERSAYRFQIPAVPGEEVVVTSENESRYDVTGSKFYAQFHEIDLAVEEAQKESKAFTQKCMDMLQKGVSQDSVMKVYNADMPAISQRFAKAMTDIVKTHSKDEAITAFLTEFEDVDQLKAAVALLSPEVREGRTKPLYQFILDQVEAQQKAEQEASQKQNAGVEAPDFTLNDINGKPLSLSSLRGKYVIIDFWGSWCGWCIKGFPEMKNYYQKYKGKFEILGVDCNDPEQKWKDAVRQYELPWLHVYNPRNSTVLADYGIQGFPTKIVVGPDGKIVKTIVGESPEFYTLLDELFK